MGTIGHAETISNSATSSRVVRSNMELVISADTGLGYDETAQEYHSLSITTAHVRGRRKKRHINTVAPNDHLYKYVSARRRKTGGTGGSVSILT